MLDKRISMIDYLRGISIFTIVVMHLCQSHTVGALHKALSFGGAGVHVFNPVLGLRAVPVVSEEAIGIWRVPQEKIWEGLDSIRYCCLSLGAVAVGIKRGFPSAGSGEPSAAL